MKTLKLLGAALAAVMMAFTAQAAKTAKAVVENDGKTLRFVYDTANYGTKGTGWFSVAETSLDVSGFNTANVVNMDGLFYECSSLTDLDVTHFDTSKVTDMDGMFANCYALASLDVTGFDTAKVKKMSYMFYNAGGGCVVLRNRNRARCAADDS